MAGRREVRERENLPETLQFLPVCTTEWVTIPFHWDREHKQMRTFEGVVFEFSKEFIDYMKISFNLHSICHMWLSNNVLGSWCREGIGIAWKALGTRAGFYFLLRIHLWQLYISKMQVSSTKGFFKTFLPSPQHSFPWTQANRLEAQGNWQRSRTTHQ